MKHFSIKKTHWDETDPYQEDKNENCKLRDCSNCVIGKIHGDFFSLYFCKEHEEEALNEYKKIEIRNIPGVVHIKLTYFSPQPIPEDIQKLAQKLNFDELFLYTVDSLTLDGIRADLYDRLRNGDCPVGERDVTL